MVMSPAASPIHTQLVVHQSRCHACWNKLWGAKGGGLHHWALLTQKQHHKEHRPQRPSEHSHPTQHAEGRTGDCLGPRKEPATRQTSGPWTHSEAGGGRPGCGGEWATTEEKTTSATPSTTPSAPTTGLRERGNDTSRSTGRSGRQKAATRRNTRKGRTGDCPGPRQETAARRNFTQGGGRGCKVSGM